MSALSNSSLHTNAHPLAVPAAELELAASLEASLLELASSLDASLLSTLLLASLELAGVAEDILDAWLEITSTAELTAREDILLLDSALLEDRLLEELWLETRLLLADDSLLWLETTSSADALLTTATAEEAMLLATLATTLLLALLLFELPPQAVSASIRLTPAARGNADFILTSLLEYAFTIYLLLKTEQGNAGLAGAGRMKGTDAFSELWCYEKVVEQ